MRRAAHVVAVSGPDGVGKTTVVRELAIRLGEDGYRVHARHLYGCVICRRLPRVHALSEARGARVRHRIVARLHAFIDALELVIRIAVARAWARRPGPRIVLTDRGPLDGLAKHIRVAGRRTLGIYRYLARRYACTIWLDAEPETLASRDRDHTVSEERSVRGAFSRASSALPGIARVDAEEPTAQVIAASRSLVLEALEDGRDA